MVKLEMGRPYKDNQISWPLSYEQERQWFLEQLNPGNAAYNRPLIIKLTGILNTMILEKSINKIFERHHVLRAYFPVKSGMPSQVIRPYQYTDLPVIDISNFSGVNREKEMNQQVIKEVRHSFDVSSDFLLRFTLVRLSSNNHLLMINIHHIIFDGWSAQIFLKELSKFYKAFVKNEPCNIPELPFQYESYSIMQREMLAGDLWERDLAYWKRQLGGELLELNLPLDYPRPIQATLEGKTYRFIIPHDVNQQIKTFCRKEKVTPSMLIMTILNILLFRYTGQQDISVGNLVSGRNQTNIEHLIGLFVNTLIMRTQLQPNMKFSDALQQVRKINLEAYSHPNMPLAKLVAEISPKRNLNGNPLFQVLLNMHNMPQANEVLPGLCLEEVDIEQSPALVDLTLKVVEVQGDLKCSLIYNKDIFLEGTIARMAGHFTTLLASALACPDKTISELPMLTIQERQELLVEWNKQEADYPRESSITQLFEEQVDLYPNDIAIIFENKQIPYHELDRRANQIANYLRKMGLSNEQLVAVCLPRSPEIIISFIGILKAGGAYVPIDLSYPTERIAFMLNDVNVSFIITTESIAKQLPNTKAKFIFLDNEEVEISAQLVDRPVNRSGYESLAYVMYTSGSTGEPKGVAIAQRGIIRLVKNFDFANLGHKEVFLNLSSLSFDGSTFEIYGSLLNGGKLVIMNSNKPSLEHIAETIKQQQVTAISVTPEMLNLLLEDYHESLGSLQQIFSGGDVLGVLLAQRCLSKLPECQLINGYGPTENTVYSTTFLVKEILPDTTTIPIGRPIADDNVFILDHYFQPVPIGVIGELYVTGEGIARGYLNNKDLTEERFLSNPFAIASRGKLYKTGDLVRYRSDKNIEFIGRVDHQVKIRGCRIELGEIEAVVGKYPGIRQIVAGTTKGNKESSDLIVYAVMQKGEIFDSHKLRTFTRQKLPDYMVPTFFVELQDIPLTPIGKIDRIKLPTPEPISNVKVIITPRNLIEEQLLQVWKELLSLQKISVTDNFFELGGHSLLAMQMFSKIEKTFAKRLPVSIIFQEDTIEKLAKVLSLNDQLDINSSLVPIQLQGNKPPLFCVHPKDGTVFSYRLLAKNLGIERPIYGLRYTNAKNDSKISINGLAAKYIAEIRRIQPIGPYFLLGFSLGGTIAYEMAQQLFQVGQEVSLLTIVDTRNIARNSYKIERGVPYKKIITNNLKKLNKLPYGEWIPFIKQKTQNAFHLVMNKPEPKYIDDKMVKLFLKALSEYKPKPYPGKLLLIRANDNQNNLLFDEQLGWETVEDGRIVVRGVPGYHGTIIKEPNVGNVAKCLREYL
ncbi:MAG: amino acid adenylation domain-containing protein [Bacillus sp. (in: Bacteria)]|nr:amino acid adenylation domain-containing protein [Bacillus sp. (in: firmicutes)]